MQFIQRHLRIIVRLMLATLSAMPALYMVLKKTPFLGAVNWLVQSKLLMTFLPLTFHGVSSFGGLVHLVLALAFGAFVLWPFLTWDRTFALKAVLLLGASVLSLECSEYIVAAIVANGPSIESSPSPFSTTSAHFWFLVGCPIGGIVGATFVAAPTQWLTKTGIPTKFWWLVIGAGGLGGLVFGYLFLEYDRHGEAAGYFVWQISLCAAMCLGSKRYSASAGEIRDEILSAPTTSSN